MFPATLAQLGFHSFEVLQEFRRKISIHKGRERKPSRWRRMRSDKVKAETRNAERAIANHQPIGNAAKRIDEVKTEMLKFGDEE